ncbi:glycosyltransferase family 2 protein [Actomonas aquatica]|uniref:Glycosyltransferase family 2 protein n=1 Tax=Actomonas aquatica TaxID=2866162 RepID=A0ABZ1CD01_9BACT|nr:glycosyltransferase family 2 protein [Opitutus sp. WL0086]WRQ88494.1 glycosyltransferase family 2 protein [Opitutus sp. WL0086]
MPAACSTPALLHHLDAPASWHDLPRRVLVRGWVFAPGAAPLQAVRARVGGTLISGNVGFHRPDVKAAYPDAPDDYTGFQIAIETPRGRFPLELEALTAGGEWWSFLELEAHGKPRRRPYIFGADSPEELLAGQLALQPRHPPRPLQPEHFPAVHLAPGTSLPVVDIVTPNLNQGRWLPAAVASTAGLDGVRHTVRDGGSTDGSVEWLRESASSLHSWVSEKDDGQADAIARGLAATAGEPEDLMAWINADDHYLPGAIEFVRRYFAAHPRVDVIYGNRVMVDEDGAEVGRWHLPPHNDDVLKLYDFVPQETLFWRRRIWDQVGGIDPTFQFALDWDLLLRFQAAGARIEHLPRFLGAFRLHAAQKSSAAIGSTGQAELDALRRRTFGRDLAPSELIESSFINRYLRRSARRELAARFGLRPSL